MAMIGSAAGVFEQVDVPKMGWSDLRIQGFLNVSIWEAGLFSSAS